MLFQNLRSAVFLFFFFARDGNQQMLGRDVLISHLFRVLVGIRKNSIRT